MEEPGFIIGAIGAGIFMICIFVGMGLFFHIAENGIKLPQWKKKHLQ